MFPCRASLFACLSVLSLAVPGERALAALAHPGAPDSYQVWRASTVEALSLRGDAPSLATAALISHDSGALGLASRADDLTPDDTAIGWIHLRVCALTPNCDIRGSATEMRWLDPDNSAAWLPTLAAAIKDRDSVELDRVLAHMAQGTRVDFYWNRIVVMMFDAMKSVSGRVRGRYADSDATRLAFVTGIAAAKIVSPLAMLADGCRESKPGTARRESCAKIVNILRHSDTVAAQLTGIRIERRFVRADSKEYRALGERRRALEWRVASAAKFDKPLLPWLTSAHARWKLQRMRTMPREEDVIVAILRDHGMPLDPPPPPPPPTRPPAPPEPLHLKPP